MSFLELWHQAAVTTCGLFWTAFWAFSLGYLISSLIQVFVTRERMQKTMGTTGPKSVALGTFFGFISSSCSFAALSTTRALFVKGAGLVPSLSFLLASTNLVVELGIVIAMFLGWQFVVGEYLGGILLILITWLFVRLTRPKKLIEAARDKAREQSSEGEQNEAQDAQGDDSSWLERLRDRACWEEVAAQYVSEWRMVWKDVAVGFTVAGVIAAFVPRSFFQALFVGSGDADSGFLAVLAQCLIGPVAAFVTFIGSMGNIPLAAVLFSNGVSFAGVMAFIFSDLVVFPVLRIQAKYYGWKMALYILVAFLIALVGAALVMHYGFSLAGLMPDSGSAKSVTEREFFKVDYTLVLNVVFALVSGGFVAAKALRKGFASMKSDDPIERALFVCALLAFAWLITGLCFPVLF